MKRGFLFLSFLFCMTTFVYAEAKTVKKIYDLTDDPIDVVIVTHPKDIQTLELSIEGIRKNCDQVRRVIIVSTEPLSDQAEWFDEKKFPFSFTDVKLQIGRGDQKKADRYFARINRGPGWYLQQLLKFYAPSVIPDISSNVLVLDSDAVFLNPVTFTNDLNGGLFCISHREAKPLYIEHAERLVPGYKRVSKKYYSVCHHMLFQKPILDDLMKIVEDHHKMPFWKAFCRSVDLTAKTKGASEYEIYSNFALRNTDQVAWRELLWVNSPSVDKREEFRREGYHFAAFHTYLRNKKLKPGGNPEKNIR